MNKLIEKIENATTIAILGHLNPDGDCIGSTLALYNYIRKVYSEKKPVVYMKGYSDKFSYLKGYEDIASEPSSDKLDLVCCLDASDEERLYDFGPMLKEAKDTICIDHHITNTGYALDTICNPNASSACEVLYELLDPALIDKDIATCLYTGIVHDTGVFKYSSTSERTMQIAGQLMSLGISFGEIIDGSFYRKTYRQLQVLGRALLESITFFDNKCIFSVINSKEMQFYGVTSKDLDGIVEQLRNTEGVECAIFLYQVDTQKYKVSLRSLNIVDVSKVASKFGGGGHIRAAGCTMLGSTYDIINNLSDEISKQLS